MASSQVVRLTTGDVIQVRTGVIQGIGPQGPTGPTGPQGQSGPQGPQGAAGPPGSILTYSTEAYATAQSCAVSTVTNNEFTTYSNMSWATIDHDDLSSVQSLSNFAFTPGSNGSDFYGAVTVIFNKQSGTNGSGSRAVRVMYQGVAIAECIVPANTLVNTKVNVGFGLRCTSNTDIMNIQIAQNDTASLSVTGALWVNQTGPGPKGDQGAQGIQGSVGPVGAQGPVGPAGSVANNTTTYATLGGDNN